MDPNDAELAFLRRAPLFKTLPDEVLRAIRASGETAVHGPGSIIFKEGSPGYDMYVIKSGIVEVRKETEGHPNGRVVSYLSAGECVGEMSLITGLPRSATVRVPQRAEIFRVPGMAFDRLLHQYAVIAISLARILAFRLQVANQLHVAPEQSASKHLSGDLQFFDLAEVCQTLNQGRRTGVMTVSAPSMGGDATLYFDEGHIRHATTASLEGRDAVLRVFRRQLQGSFEFRTTDAYEGPAEEPSIAESPMGLILEAIRQMDEIEAVKKAMPPESHRFKRRLPALPWAAPVRGQDEKTRARMWAPADERELLVAREVFDGLSNGRTLGQLVELHPADEHTVYKSAHALWKGGALV